LKRLFGIGRKPKTFEFQCSDCGDIHRGSPSFGYEKPTFYFEVPESDREARIKISSDFCSIMPAKDDLESDTQYFIRATLDVPIEGVNDPFLWGVWVSQSKENFDRYYETYDEDQSGDGSFGWLSINLPSYNLKPPGQPLDNLACDVEWLLSGDRPKIWLHECDHQLYIDQRDGISWERAIEIAKIAMHGEN